MEPPLQSLTSVTFVTVEHPPHPQKVMAQWITQHQTPIMRAKALRWDVGQVYVTAGTEQDGGIGIKIFQTRKIH